MKVGIIATGLATYPDVTVICGPLVRDPRDSTAVINPRLLVEVTSPSTEDYDRGDRLSHYRQIPSLQAVLIVAHASKCVTIVERSATEWTVRDVRLGEVIGIEKLGIAFDVDAVYAALEGL